MLFLAIEQGQVVIVVISFVAIVPEGTKAATVARSGARIVSAMQNAPEVASDLLATNRVQNRFMAKEAVNRHAVVTDAPLVSGQAALIGVTDNL